MAGVPNLTDTWKVVYRMHLGAEKIENVVHVTYPTLSSPQALADKMGAAWVATGSIKSRMTNQLTYDQISVQSYDGASAPVDCLVTGYTGQTGGLGLVPTSSQTAQVITLRSLTSGRSARGRMYVAGVGGTDITNNGTAMNPTAVGLNQAAADTWRTAINTGSPTVVLVIYSQLHNSKVSCSAVVARSYLGTQRGRANAAMHP